MKEKEETVEGGESEGSGEEGRQEEVRKEQEAKVVATELEEALLAEPMEVPAPAKHSSCHCWRVPTTNLQGRYCR